MADLLSYLSAKRDLEFRREQAAKEYELAKQLQKLREEQLKTDAERNRALNEYNRQQADAQRLAMVSVEGTQGEYDTSPDSHMNKLGPLKSAIEFVQGPELQGPPSPFGPGGQVSGGPLYQQLWQLKPEVQRRQQNLLDSNAGFTPNEAALGALGKDPYENRNAKLNALVALAQILTQKGTGGDTGALVALLAKDNPEMASILGAGQEPGDAAARKRLMSTAAEMADVKGLFDTGTNDSLAKRQFMTIMDTKYADSEDGIASLLKAYKSAGGDLKDPEILAKVEERRAKIDKGGPLNKLNEIKKKNEAAGTQAMPGGRAVRPEAELGKALLALGQGAVSKGLNLLDYLRSKDPSADWMQNTQTQTNVPILPQPQLPQPQLPQIRPPMVPDYTQHPVNLLDILRQYQNQ